MNDGDGPSGGIVLAAVFMIIAGLCLALVGGGCTVLIFAEFDPATGGGGDSYVPFLLLSLAVLGLGIGLIWLAVRLLRGGSNR